MGISSSKQKTTSQSRSTEQAKTTPTNPGWVTDALKDYTGAVSQWGQTDPSSLVAGPSALQSQAFSQIGNLGNSYKSGIEQAMGLADRAANAPANLSENTTLGSATMASADGYAASLAEKVRLGELTQAQAASMLDGGLDRYQNPATQALVDTTLADFDVDAGRTRAAQAAAAARNGAFGGSRYGVQEAATEGELARARASADAQLRDRAFTQAVGMAQYDATNRQNTGLFNAGEANRHTQLQGQLDQQRNIANAGFRNDASAFGAAARNQASIFNAGQQNQFALTQGQMDQQNSQFNAGQQDNALGRRLQAAGLMGDLTNSYANNRRADIGLTAELGAEQRAIAQQQAQARLAQLQAQGQLLGAIPFDLFRGQDISTTGNSSGSGTQTTSGLGGILGAGLAGWASGGFRT